MEPRPALVAILFGLTLVSQVTDENAAYTAVMCPTPITDDRMLQCSRFHRLVRVLNGQFAIYSGYHQIGHSVQVGLTAGSFLTVQVHHRSRMQLLHNLLDLLDDQESSATVSEDTAMGSQQDENDEREVHSWGKGISPTTTMFLLSALYATDDYGIISLLFIGLWRG